MHTPYELSMLAQDKLAGFHAEAAQNQLAHQVNRIGLGKTVTHILSSLCSQFNTSNRSQNLPLNQWSGVAEVNQNE